MFVESVDWGTLYIVIYLAIQDKLVANLDNSDLSLYRGCTGAYR